MSSSNTVTRRNADYTEELTFLWSAAALHQIRTAREQNPIGYRRSPERH